MVTFMLGSGIEINSDWTFCDSFMVTKETRKGLREIGTHSKTAEIIFTVVLLKCMIEP